MIARTCIAPLETSTMKRQPWARTAATVLAASVLGAAHGAATDDPAPERFELLEATIPQIRAAQRANLVSVEQLTRMYLKRIEAYEAAGPAINAYLHVNANAAREARKLDSRARRRNAASQPLYGVPILLKDNIDTADMPTTAGSVAL